MHSPEGLCPTCVLAHIAEATCDSSAGSEALTDAAIGPPGDDARFEPGDRFGPYRIDRFLGCGGMGEVYEVEHLEQERRLALKVLHHGLRRSDDRARFLSEGQLAAAITHPNSVYVFGAHEIVGIPVIAMELLPGETLRDRVAARGPMPAAEAVDVILHVVDGLAAAHAAGVLHRDVKPSNCFVDLDGTVKVGDFGLSIPVGSLDGMVVGRAPSFAGTPEFAAPEQFLGERLDVRTDIYSVGATLYFLLTGRPPFEHSTLDGLVTKITSAPVQFSDAYPQLPRGVAAIVRRCLAKAPGQRFATYADLRRVLAPFASAAATPAPLSVRAVAAVFDAIVVVPIAAIVLGGLVGSQLVRDPVTALLLIGGLFVIYWGVLEGRFGAAYGKRRCGIRVVRGTGDRPGLLRGLARALIFVLPFLSAIVAVQLIAATTGRPAAMVIALGAAAVALVAPVRGNGGLALQDVVVGTRVVTWPPAAPPTIATVAHRAPELTTGPPIGPYLLISGLGATDRGQILRAWDPQLKRRVWIHQLVAPGPPLVSTAMKATRPGQLRWLHSHRTEAAAWDAYESLDGQPFLFLTRGQSWRSVSIWLSDLARELASRDGGDATEALSLERIWVTADGRGKLLGFRAPRLSPETVSANQFPLSQAQQFLHAAACRALDAPVPPPPLAVSRFLRTLERGGFSSLSAVVSALRTLEHTPDRVTTASRGMTLALGVVVYLVTANVIGGVVLNDALPAVAPGVAGRLGLTVPAAGLIVSAALALWWAMLFRGGAWLRGCRIAVVTPDGTEVSRARACLRASIAWSWVPVQVAAMLWGGPLLPIAVAKIVGLVYAADHPARGFQDRVAGTYLVPR